MLYEGPLYTFFDARDNDKSVVIGTETDSEGELYLAFHLDGKPMLRNAVFGKRYGRGKGDESAGKTDKRSFMYLSRAAQMELYDLLGHIFQGEIQRETHVINMESPEHNEGVTVNDMLNAIEGQ